MGSLVYLILVVSWIAGIVLAKGFWLTVFAYVFPPYGYYLVVEKLLIHYGII